MVLVRHGETEWSASGRHTSRTELALTERGRSQAAAAGAQLLVWLFAEIWASPRARALDSARLAGFAERVEVRDDLAEWDYGDYEGRTSADILAVRPGWDLFADGCPGGESPAEVAIRADRVVAQARAAAGPVAVFAHGHILRVVASRWIDESVAFGAKLGSLGTSSVGVLGEEKD